MGVFKRFFVIPYGWLLLPQHKNQLLLTVTGITTRQPIVLCTIGHGPAIACACCYPTFVGGYYSLLVRA
ncbi:hypothetical protein MBAV_003089 [Candidatus Magnetobacterium bavaricum]|uniref:Uncharacterized protein n=1 Tax=Candidatus Magnetobacterium bavaricum TaxID=29290 RepID=A0A0F3GS41_9BACT|nr:hypothetical protein MBAV_003089 [Candidatus Magnetobacterium bavaricum]